MSARPFVAQHLDELLEALIAQLHHVGFGAVSPFKAGDQRVFVERLGGDCLRCCLGLPTDPIPGELPGKWQVLKSILPFSLMSASRTCVGAFTLLVTWFGMAIEFLARRSPAGW